MMYLKEIDEAQTIEDLRALGIGEVIVKISHRGGYVGFSDRDVSKCTGLPEHLLPRKVGAACNYLGGGIRGAIFHSDFSSEISERDAEWIVALCEACERAYIDAESFDNEWDEAATIVARGAGTRSAY